MKSSGLSGLKTVANSPLWEIVHADLIFTVETVAFFVLSIDYVHLRSREVGDGSRLFDKAMLWELLNVERNPMDLVEVKGISKRKKRPQVLQVKDAWQILDALVQPFRTIAAVSPK